MRSIVKFSCLAIAFAAILSGCSMNLTQGDLEGIPLTEENYSFFGNIPFIYGGDSLELSQDLLRAYTKAASEKEFSRESCRGEATIKATVHQNEPNSAWNIGVLIPLWPILPVNESWTYELSARIFCNGTLVRHVEFIEQQDINAILYGRLRTDLVNKASNEMHRKLVQRLAFELNGNRLTDLNSVSDY
ncbi:putative lipoprotein [Fibrobacter succinogenes subsp. succinogenes S85]|uniref:Putative lipoprotein n=1 Tax=Fibrobacter succinogenes (strain ATCC 19169 / S85) TaxID=59374 RepID=C9RKB9_FIBSS|nr:hypothetical protein [Fibrobacter succinogenes]ACX75852.1 hypothetical protein Fisuc_2266 [Fibrobacter succinogenes subsp. succinogenes S85]ADL24734.1 putative lipoprotein [Fibrobacter succinogenes subsp. succinogenes S85]